MKLNLKNLFREKEASRLLTVVQEQIQLVRQSSNVLVLYGQPTQNNWLGIATATQLIYPASSVEIPQHYSTSVFTEKQVSILCNFIKTQGFEKIIISGFASYFFEWIRQLKNTLIIEAVYHGTISEFHTKSNQDFILRLVRLSQNKTISHIYFIKEGMDCVFSKLYHISCSHLKMPQIPLPEKIEKLTFDSSKIHVGVFGSDTFNKNLHNQVIHALLIENVVVHVLDKTPFAYLQQEDRIIGHGKLLSRENFLSLLVSMDVNLYMSFNESFGLVAAESEQLGVPCLKTTQPQYLFLIEEILKSVKR